MRWHHWLAFVHRLMTIGQLHAACNRFLFNHVENNKTSSVCRLSSGLPRSCARYMRICHR